MREKMGITLYIQEDLLPPKEKDKESPCQVNMVKLNGLKFLELILPEATSTYYAIHGTKIFVHKVDVLI